MKPKWPGELLEYLAQKAGCGYLSDLLYLSPWEQFHLSREILRISPEAFPLNTWNDALVYLTGLPPEAGASAAQEALIQHLAEHSSDLRGYPSQGHL